MESVLLSIENGIAYITLNRPDKGNAFLPEVKAELTQILRSIRGDYSVRAVIVSANGRIFSAGGDLGSMGDKQNCVQGRDRMRLAMDWLKELINLEKPTIAAVNGAASGSGLSLALACDFIIAAEPAKFISSFINIGLVSDMASLYFLPRRVGLAKAKQIAFSGKPVLSAEALKIGLADKVVPLDELQAEAKAMAGEYAAMPTYSIGMTKKLANCSFEMDIDSFLDMEVNYQAVAFQTEDHKNAVKAFFDKEPAVFEGK